MKILMAMSGGVDSSVAAHLLIEQGHDVIGVMMQLWVDPLAPAVRGRLPKKCCSLEHIQRARTVCAELGIPFYVLNLEDAFKTDIIDPFLAEYQAGKTPNPCIECNKKIKFGRLFEYAQELGCDRLATGHYAIIEQDEKGLHVLRRATDENKDQSYYLYGLSQEVLAKVMFPLGKMMKSEVYELATKYRVSVPEYYQESQDLCFYPENTTAPFLKRYLQMEPGDIQLEDGTVVGKHEGLPLYTVGQRRGLGIGGLQIPLHVVSKSAASNTIFVAPDGADSKLTMFVKDPIWIAGEPPETAAEYSVRISSLGQMHAGTLRKKHNDRFEWEFNQAIRGIAPGQSAVIYQGDRVVGGGIIAEGGE